MAEQEEKTPTKKIRFFQDELREWIEENPEGDIGYRLTRVKGSVFSLQVVYSAEETTVPTIDSNEAEPDKPLPEQEDY